MILETSHLEWGNLHRIICTECNTELATYYVYINNGLIDPPREFRRQLKVHRCETGSTT
jgi:hypothetical protein